MHVLFVHKSFPAQFGHIGSYLSDKHGWRATFVSEAQPGSAGGVDNIQYSVKGAATKDTHYCSRTFENGVWHAAAVYDALRPVSAVVKPDLIVGHSGFGSTLFLNELYPDVPVVNYFEYFYRARNSDLDFRPDVPVQEADRLRSYARNAMILLDMQYCTAGYSPTRYQHSLMPDAYRDKIRVLHDGIDTRFWRPRELEGRRVGNLELDDDTRLVTYCSRGLESMRGFDVFMRAAKLIYEARPNVKFVVVGGDKVAYGGDLRHTGGKTFKDHVLAQDDYDLSRVLFVGHVAPDVLAQLFSLTDLHFYLTVPFVLSWSMLDAMACGAVVLGSDTPPVAEVIADGENGLLSDFFDHEALAARALEVLEDPAAFRAAQGEAARQTIADNYGMDVIMPRMAELYTEAAEAPGP
jgi:glycosyltransferase involved in cell wall biosynthesis